VKKTGSWFLVKKNRFLVLGALLNRIKTQVQTMFLVEKNNVLGSSCLIERRTKNEEPLTRCVTVP